MSNSTSNGDLVQQDYKTWWLMKSTSTTHMKFNLHFRDTLDQKLKDSRDQLQQQAANEV